MNHVLLIPLDGDPHGLLAEGVCGSRPPVACRHEAWTELREWVPWTPEHEWSWWRKALVLAWDGKPARDGALRAAMALAEAQHEPGAGTVPFLHAAYWAEYESDGSDGENVVAFCVANEGVFWRFPLDADTPNHDDERLLAMVCAARGLATLPTPTPRSDR